MSALMQINGIKKGVMGDYYSGFIYGQLFDFDMYLTGISLAYFGAEKYLVNELRMFLKDMTKQGFIHRRINSPILWVKFMWSC